MMVKNERGLLAEYSRGIDMDLLAKTGLDEFKRLSWLWPEYKQPFKE